MTNKTALPTGRVAIVALFVTALVTAQLTASKVLAFTNLIVNAVSNPGRFSGAAS